jgi:hypothetical protein
MATAAMGTTTAIAILALLLSPPLELSPGLMAPGLVEVGVTDDPVSPGMVGVSV